MQAAACPPQESAPQPWRAASGKRTGSVSRSRVRRPWGPGKVAGWVQCGNDGPGALGL